MATNGVRAQSALELIVSYGWALLILLLVLAGLGFYIGALSHAAPASCKSIGPNSYCNGVFIQSSQATQQTQVTFDLVNSQPYEVRDPVAYISINNVSTSQVQCMPNNVLQGGAIICTVPVNQGLSTGSQLSGTFYLTVQNCAGLDPSCSSPVSEILTGTFLGSAQSQLQPASEALLLSTANANPSAGGTDQVTATLMIGNALERSATIDFTSSNSAFGVTPELSATNSSGEASSLVRGSSPGTTVISANFGPIGNSITLTFH